MRQQILVKQHRLLISIHNIVTKNLFSLLIFSCIAVSAFAQEDQKPPTAEPKTKLEALETKAGTVMVRAYSIIGTIRERVGSVTVKSVEFTDLISGNKNYGIAITVKGPGRPERESTTFVDYDEIDSLIKSIDYIAKVDKSITKLDAFETEYRSSGDLRVITFNDTKTGKIMAAVNIGGLATNNAWLSLNGLASFKNLITQAKAKLDTIRQPVEEGGTLGR